MFYVLQNRLFVEVHVRRDARQFLSSYGRQVLGTNADKIKLSCSRQTDGRVVCTFRTLVAKLVYVCMPFAFHGKLGAGHRLWNMFCSIFADG
jgi:hypothetical protein